MSNFLGSCCSCSRSRSGSPEAIELASVPTHSCQHVHPELASASRPTLTGWRPQSIKAPEIAALLRSFHELPRQYWSPQRVAAESELRGMWAKSPSHPRWPGDSDVQKYVKILDTLLFSDLLTKTQAEAEASVGGSRSSHASSRPPTASHGESSRTGASRRGSTRGESSRHGSSRRESSRPPVTSRGESSRHGSSRREPSRRDSRREPSRSRRSTAAGPSLTTLQVLPRDQWEAYPPTEWKVVGRTFWSPSFGEPHVLVQVSDMRERPLVASKPYQRRAAIISTIVHELAHSIFEVYGCNGRRCAELESQITGSGIHGHGPSWEDVCGRVQEVMQRFDFYANDREPTWGMGVVNSAKNEQEEARRQWAHLRPGRPFPLRIRNFPSNAPDYP